MMQHQPAMGPGTSGVGLTNAPRLSVPKGGVIPLLDEPFLAQSPNVASTNEHSRASPFGQQQQQQPNPPIVPNDLEPIGSLSLPEGLAAPAYLMPSNPATPYGSPYSSPRRSVEPRAGNIVGHGSFGHSNLRPSKLGPASGALQTRLDG